MTRSIQRELLIPQSPERVWQALTESATLAEWLYPNDFEPRIGHRFTFRVPPKPAVGFDGLTVQCEVLECDPPRRLAFSWSVPGPVANTVVTFRLESAGGETRVYFEHAGFDESQPYGTQAVRGAEFGWAQMLERLVTVVANLAPDPT